jgi:hypothetical protein
MFARFKVVSDKEEPATICYNARVFEAYWVATNMPIGLQLAEEDGCGS